MRAAYRWYNKRRYRSAVQRTLLISKGVLHGRTLYRGVPPDSQRVATRIAAHSYGAALQLGQSSRIRVGTWYRGENCTNSQ